MIHSALNAIGQWGRRVGTSVAAWAVRLWKKFLVAFHDRDSLLWYGLTLFGTAFLFFAFALVTNLFTIPLSGDYVLQQIPFYLNGYDDWWHFLKTGEFVLWDSSTYLGVNNIGANAFYYLLNPFFLPILIFPRVLVPQGLALLMMLKMVGAGFVFRGFMKYMGISEHNARLFGMVYAFCGWNVYYLWFNHFMEVCLVFPLVFWGIEKLEREKKPWLLMFSLFLMGITNFFFLISTCFVAVFYALFRYFQRIRSYKAKEAWTVAGLGVMSFAAGILMSAYVVLPAAVVALTSNRATGTYLPNLLAAIKIKNWVQVIKYVTSWESFTSATYDKWYPLITFFFPTVSCRSSALLNTGSYDNTISSLFIFTPIMFFLVPSVLNSVRKHKWSHLIAIALILFALFTPFFYFALQGFTSVDYGRWQIFVVLCMLTYIAVNYEERAKMPRWYFDVSFLFVIGMAIFVYFVAQHYEDEYSFGDMEERRWIAFGEMIYMVAVYIYLRKQFKRQVISRTLLYMVAAEAVVMGTLTMNIHSLTNYIKDDDNGIAIVQDETKIVQAINRDDPEFFRMYNLNAGESSNLGMREGYNGMTTFHSLYNFNTTEFNSWSHMNYNYNGWSLGYHEKRYNLDAFLGVKYYIVRNIYDTYSWTNVPDEYGHTVYTHQNVPLGFIRMAQYSTNLHTVYMNTNFVEAGFSYDNIIQTNYNESSGGSDFYGNYADEPIANEEAYLKGAVLRNDDAAEVLESAPNLTLGNRPAMNAYQYTYAKSGTNVTTPVEHRLRVTKLMCSTSFKADDPTNSEGCTSSLVESSVVLSALNTPRFIITPWTDADFGTAEGGYAYYLRWILDSHATVYLYDDANQLIVRDAHSFVSTSFKYMRGYYSAVPVSKIVVIPHNITTRTLYFPNLYTESYTDYLARLDNLRAYPLENVEHTANTFQFDTHYDARRFVVMQMPYDEGWHVTVTHEDGTTETPKVYKAQGGFVGFLAGEGACHYEVAYWTPYLTQGLILSLTGFLIFGGSWGAAFFIMKKKDEKEKKNGEDTTK